MSTSIEIEPVKISERIFSLDLHVPYSLNGQDCSVIVAFKNKEGVVRKTCKVPITEAEYRNWTVSDEYIIQIVLQKLKLEKRYENKYKGTPLEDCEKEEDWVNPFNWLFHAPEELSLDELLKFKIL